jgi:hypothetical protein
MMGLIICAYETPDAGGVLLQQLNEMHTRHGRDGIGDFFAGGQDARLEAAANAAVGNDPREILPHRRPAGGIPTASLAGDGHSPLTFV